MMNSSTFEARLHALRNEMTARINAIDKDVRHREDPVEKDFAEQVTQGENDDVLNALDDEAKTIVLQIDAALSSIRASTYGICKKCGKPIAEKRLEAIPYATTCIECAE